MVCIINEAIHFMRFITSDWNYNQQYILAPSNIYNILELIMGSRQLRVTVTPLSLYRLLIYAGTKEQSLQICMKYFILNHLHTTRHLPKTEKWDYFLFKQLSSSTNCNPSICIKLKVIYSLGPQKQQRNEDILFSFSTIHAAIHAAILALS